MRAVDTNVLARYILDDDPIQSPIARRVVRGGIFIPRTVLLETAWLLRSRYQFERADIVHALSTLLDMPDVFVTAEAEIRWSIERFEAGADFADMLHLLESARQSSFATFDQDIAARAGPDSPIPVELLTA